MSGKKSWEVANVLSEVEKAQEEIVKNYQNSINKNLSEIDNIQKEVLNGEINKKINAVKDEKLKNDFKGYKKYFEESEKIKKEFKNVLAQRDKAIKRAGEIRNIIKNKSHYATNEYNEAVKIRQNINKCKSDILKLKTDSEKLKHKVIKLQSFIDNVEDIFQARKEFVEKIYSDVDDKFYKEEYVLLEDIAEKRDVKIPKVEYYDHYKKEKNFEKIKEGLKKVNGLIAQNKFDEAEVALNKLNDEIIKISNEADKMKEDMESGFYLALKIRDIMLDRAEFSKANIDLINGNPLKGFKVYTQNGDTINFDEVKIDDGKVVVNLDHIEGKAGTCGVRWENIKKIFNEEGIPLTDVTKNGYSVIYHSGVKRKENGQSKERGGR